MTIITLALTSNRRLALVADRLYNPFSKPQFMVKPKIFRRGSIAIGVSGDICAIDLNRLLDGDLTSQVPSEAHVIYVNEDTRQVRIAKPFGENTFSTWFDPLLTGEPVTIGCFARIVDNDVYGSVPTVELANSRISHLHLAYGHDEPADVIELNIDYDKLIFDHVVDSCFGTAPSEPLEVRTSSVRTPFTKHRSNKNLLSGLPLTITAEDFEHAVESLAKLFNLTEGRSQP